MDPVIPGMNIAPEAASVYKRRGEVLFLLLYSVGRGDSFTGADAAWWR